MATTLVILSISGNGLGFGDVLQCLNERMQPTRAGDCEELLGEEDSQWMAEMPMKLDHVHDQIWQRARNAHVVVTGCLPLLIPGAGTPRGGRLPIRSRHERWH